MGKYSSDSDSSRSKTYSRRGRRHSSSSEDESRQNSVKSKHSSSRRDGSSTSSRYRSRCSPSVSSPRDRRRRSCSPSKDRRRRSLSSSYSRERRRSRSKEKKGRRRSRSRENKKRSRSRDKRKSRSRDRKRSRSKGRKRSNSNERSSRSSKVKSSRRRSSSSSSCNSLKERKSVKKDSGAEALREKLLQAIKAAEGADKQLKEQGIIPTNVRSRNDLDILVPVKPDPDAVNEINEDSFVPRSFKSSKLKTSEPEIKTERPEKSLIPTEKTVFHSSFFEDPQVKLDRWVKKLFQIRQRALSEQMSPMEY